MFFIFGTPRSGTTILAQCLSSHADIVIPYETDFIVPLALLCDRLKKPDVGREIISKVITESDGFKSSINEFLNPQDVHRILQSCTYHPAVILEAIYTEIAKKASAKIAGDKSPNDIHFIKSLVETKTISEKSKIIHIVRDIRDVMESLNRMGWLQDADLYFPRFWNNDNLYMNNKFKDNASQYHFVRYEDMVQHPQQTFIGICEFLGVEYKQEILSPASRHPRYQQLTAHENLYKPITPDRVGVYKKELDQETIRSYEIQAIEAMRTFGYKPEYITDTESGSNS